MATWFDKPHVSRTLRLDVAMAEKIRVAAADANQSQNAWISQALRRALKNWELGEDFMARGRERGQGHKRESIGKGITLFDLTKCHESGFPHGYSHNPRSEIGQEMNFGGGPEAVKAKMQQAWRELDLGEYTDAHLAETLKWFTKQKKTAPAKAAAI